MKDKLLDKMTGKGLCISVANSDEENIQIIKFILDMFLVVELEETNRNTDDWRPCGFPSDFNNKFRTRW